jgi:aryl-alcohol dehydrogenase-like predicted oxidoreductase
MENPLHLDTPMNLRRLGSTDLELTVLGLGTWAIGGPDWKFGWGASDDDAAVRAVVHGVERGFNWIDTAAIYGDGHAEVLVGRALRELGPARRPIVATKCGRIMGPDGMPYGRLTRASVIAECEASLERLGVDVIDLYQIHWPDPEAEIEEGHAAVAELIAAGKVRHAGVSNFSVEQMERVRAVHPIASLQPPYSMLRRGVEDALPYSKEHGIGVVAYSPMFKGLLTGRFSAERAASLPADDHRSRDPQFQPPLLALNLAVVDTLTAVASRHGNFTAAHVALAWVLRRPEVTSAIVGVRSPEQVDGLVAAADLTLTAADLQEIEAALTQRELGIAELAG